MLADLPASWKSRSFGYEPFMDVIPEVRQQIFKSWGDIEALCAVRGKPSVISIFEVFEHFPVALQIETIERVADTLSPGGHLVMSVPVEGGIPSLVKNIFRRARYGGRGVYSSKNIIRSALWKEVPEAREGSDYLTHMGFYYHDLLDLIDDRFFRLKLLPSPFKFLPATLNSQIFIVARIKP